MFSDEEFLEEEMAQQAYPNLTPKGNDVNILPGMRRRTKRKIGQPALGSQYDVLSVPSGGSQTSGAQ